MAEKFGIKTAEYDDIQEIGNQETEILFDAKKGTLLIGLGGKELIDTQFLEDIEGKGFDAKDELHMTVIGFKQGNSLKKVITKNPALENEIANLVAEMQWDIQPTGERYELSKEYEGEDSPRKSIIEMVSSPGSAVFIERLNTLTGLELEEQPPHVTLATQGNPMGIGVNSGQDILELGHRLS